MTDGGPTKRQSPSPRLEPGRTRSRDAPSATPSTCEKPPEWSACRQGKIPVMNEECAWVLCDDSVVVDLLKETRQLHKVAPHLAYAEHPASSPRAANTESLSVCATTRKASVRRVRDPHPCEENAHAPMGSKSPAFKGRASLLTREVCNIRGNASMARTGAYTRSACGRPSDRRGARRDRGEHAPGAKGTNAASRVRVWQGRAAGTVRQMIGAALRPEIRALRPRSLSN